METSAAAAGGLADGDRVRVPVPVRGRWSGGLVVVAATAVVVAPGAATGSWRWLLAAGLLLAALTAVAALVTGPASLRAVAFLDTAFLVFAGGAHLRWPPALTTVLVCVLPPAVLLATGRIRRLHPTAPWLRVGRRPDQLVLLLALSTILAAGAALTTWTVVATPSAPPYFAQLHQLPLWVAILGVAAFAAVNPIWEEALFRGVVLEELTAIWGARTAVVVQAVLFGAAHWAGFPSGWVGMAMAALWGFVLGVIRLRTGGIALPYLVHVGANAVIGVLALALLR